MKRKKAAAAFLAVLLLTAVCLPVSAHSWEADDFTFTVPEKFVYTFGPDTPEDDPSWALAGLADAASLLRSYQESGVIADFYTEDKSVNIQVMQKSNDYSQNIYNLKDLTEEELEKNLNQLLQSKSDQITLGRSYHDVAGQPFYRFQIDGTGLSGENSEIHELLYGTIFNGHTLNFDMHSEQAFTEEQTSLLEEMVNSVQITQVVEKPAPSPVETFSTALMLVLLAAAVVIPLMYVPIKNKRDKKKKAVMAERLSEYHKTHGKDGVEGEIRFANATDCTKEAVRSFSVYQAYIKNIGGLLLGALMCFLVLVLSFLLDMDWWIKLVAVGVTVYYAYKIIGAAGSTERVQTKVFGRGVSSTARYAFYDEAFRVSGIQSASVYPYFQITDVRRHGHYLYLYYGPENAYLVDQFGFSLGEFEEFQAFILEKTRKKAG